MLGWPFIALLLSTLLVTAAIKFQRLHLRDISPQDRPFIIDNPSHVKVAPAGHKGEGLFALRDISAHCCIGYYQGEVLTQKEYESRLTLHPYDYDLYIEYTIMLQYHLFAAIPHELAQVD